MSNGRSYVPGRSRSITGKQETAPRPERAARIYLTFLVNSAAGRDASQNPITSPTVTAATANRRGADEREAADSWFWYPPRDPEPGRLLTGHEPRTRLIAGLVQRGSRSAPLIEFLDGGACGLRSQLRCRLAGGNPRS